MTIKTEEQARANGYTAPIVWNSGDGFGGRALVRPDADLDGDFRGFCLEDGEMVLFHGWAIYAKAA